MHTFQDNYNNDLDNIQISKIFDLNSSIKEFKNEEFQNILDESTKINNILKSLENEKDKIINNLNIEPKTLHLAHQHLCVIQNNLKEQLYELQLLYKNLEINNIVQLEKNNSYKKMNENCIHFNYVLKIFLPYIIIFSIYLKLSSSNYT
jgi:hypothetical protein